MSRESERHAGTCATCRWFRGLALVSLVACGLVWWMTHHD